MKIENKSNDKGMSMVDVKRLELILVGLGTFL